MTLKDIMCVVAAYVPRSISSLVCHKDRDWSLSFFTWLIWRSLLASGHVWSLHQYADENKFKILAGLPQRLPWLHTSLSVLMTIAGRMRSYKTEVWLTSYRRLSQPFSSFVRRLCLSRCSPGHLVLCQLSSFGSRLNFSHGAFLK